MAGRSSSIDIACLRNTSSRWENTDELQDCYCWIMFALQEDEALCDVYLLTTNFCVNSLPSNVDENILCIYLHTAFNFV